MLAAVLIGSALIAGGVWLATDDSKSAPTQKGPRQNAIAPAPSLVETLGANTPLGDYEAEQFGIRGFDSFNSAGNYNGWAGAFPDHGRLKVYWKGPLPTELRTNILPIADRLPVDIYSTTFSYVELDAAFKLLSSEYFGKGVCAGYIPPGTDTVHFTTDQDPASVDLPTKTASGIPIIVTRESCPVATVGHD